MIITEDIKTRLVKTWTTKKIKKIEKQVLCVNRIMQQQRIGMRRCLVVEVVDVGDE